MRRPTIRFAYWIGMRRWPSWTKTTDETMASAMSGKKIRSIGPPFHHALTPSGALVRMEAKMRIEMPLPMPRLVICSPSHISSTVPVVRETTMSVMRPGFACSASWRWNSTA